MAKQYGTRQPSFIQEAMRKKKELEKKYKFVSSIVPSTNPRPDVVQETFANPKQEVVAESPEYGKFVVYVSDKTKRELPQFPKTEDAEFRAIALDFGVAPAVLPDNPDYGNYAYSTKGELVRLNPINLKIGKPVWLSKQIKGLPAGYWVIHGNDLDVIYNRFVEWMKGRKQELVGTNTPLFVDFRFYLYRAESVYDAINALGGPTTDLWLNELDTIEQVGDKTLTHWLVIKRGIDDYAIRIPAQGSLTDLSNKGIISKDTMNDPNLFVDF